MHGLITNKKRILKTIITIFFAVITSSLSASDEYKTTTNLNFRSGAGSEFLSMGIIKKGETVKVTDKTNPLWYRVEYQSRVGYLFSEYLIPVEVDRPKIDSEPNESNSSLLVIIALVIVAIIIYTFNRKKTPISPSSNYSSNSNRIHREETINSSLQSKKASSLSPISYKVKNDDSIIDVTGESYKIIPAIELKKYGKGIPYWAHHYVYSFSEIKYATEEQKNFYFHFKTCFLNGEHYDLEGNTNYAFILLFDLLNEYENHKDIPILEKQLDILGYCYPKTKSYGVSFLMEKMDACGDIDGLSRLKAQNTKEFNYSYTDYDYWRIGSKYKTKLNLNDEEEALLNKLWYPSNVFCNIEYCYLEILKLFIATIAELTNKYNQEGTSLDEQFSIVADVIAKKHFNYRFGSLNYKYCIESTTKEIYSHIFKHCENCVREQYGHKRKINTNSYYSTTEVNLALESKIISKVSEILPILISKIKPPDELTEIELYTLNTNRWKLKFDEITTNYKDDPKQFIDDIMSLANLNKKNPSVEIIFFEASKFISKSNQEAALTLYIHYLYHDLKSVVFDNRQFTKTIQKSLFKTNEQLHEFEIIVSELINDKNLEKALLGISKIYAVKRKKIKLDSESIKEVQEQHSETVELLNEYLNDEYEDEHSAIKTQEINTEEVKIEITQKTDEVQNSNYLNSILFNQLHIAVLEKFAKNNFSIPQSEFESFAKSNGVFTNQLIESINEVCYETLDDVLIEEEDDYYIISPNYYQNILAK